MHNKSKGESCSTPICLYNVFIKYKKNCSFFDNLHTRMNVSAIFLTDYITLNFKGLNFFWGNIVLRRDLIDEINEAPAPLTPSGINFNSHFSVPLDPKNLDHFTNGVIFFKFKMV